MRCPTISLLVFPTEGFWEFAVDGVLLFNTKNLSGISMNRTAENQVVIPQIYLGGGDRYKIDTTTVTVKSRCVAEIANIACNINTL
jgi:hypothetical protein